MLHLQFSDLEIRIFQRENNGYPVEIQLDGQQQFRRGYLSADILSWQSNGDLSAEGRQLFKTLFADPSLRSAWDQASGQAPQRRIRLWIDAQAPELHVIPWELLRESNILLATDPKTPFSRYLPCDIRHGEPVVERPIRILVVISNPRDLNRYKLVSLDVAEERQRLEAALGTLPDIQLDFLTSPVTLKRLEDHLHKGYHILHYIGHGAFSKRRGEAALYLQDEAGNTNVVPAAQLCELLGCQSPRPHLVFLSACESATRDTTDAFRGLGPQLIAAGIPAVVAMQDQVSMVTARELSHTFYTRLLEHGVVDLALNQARGALVTQNRPDAAIPILFMRLKDGRLWERSIYADETTPIPNLATEEDSMTIESKKSATLERARRALEILEEQAAGYTALTIPTHLKIELEEKRREVANLERRIEGQSESAVRRTSYVEGEDNALKDHLSSRASKETLDRISPTNTVDLRQRLQHLDNVEIESLCLDHFPAIYDKFSRGLRRDEMINLLLSHCRRNPEAAAQLTALL